MHHKPFGSSDRESGKDFENSFFGRCRVTSINTPYVKYVVAMRMAREIQPSDVLHERGARLRDLVASHLGVPASTVRFFTALDSAFDLIHSIDAWLEVDAFPGVRVTIDLTTSNKRGYKAHVVISPDDVLTDYVATVADIAWQLRHPPLRA